VKTPGRNDFKLGTVAVVLDRAKDYQFLVKIFKGQRHMDYTSGTSCQPPNETEHKEEYTLSTLYNN